MSPPLLSLAAVREVKYLRQLLKQFTEKNPSLETALSSPRTLETQQHTQPSGSVIKASPHDLQQTTSPPQSSLDQQRILTLEKENLLLKRELESYSSQSQSQHHGPPLGHGGQGPGGHLSPRPPLAQATTKHQQQLQHQHEPSSSSSSALSEQYDMLWTQTESLQTTLKKFFAYQIEEEVMRQLVEQVSGASCA
jgi:hypothetical protein